MMFGSSQKEFFKSVITEVRDQCGNTKKRDTLFSEMFSIEGTEPEISRDWPTSFQSDAGEQWFITTLKKKTKRRKYHPHTAEAQRKDISLLHSRVCSSQSVQSSFCG